MTNGTRAMSVSVSNIDAEQEITRIVVVHVCLGSETAARV
jgi:hypothetical protein